MFLEQFAGFAPVDLVGRFEEAFALHMSVPKQGERSFGPESSGDLPVGVRLVDPVKSFCRDGEVEGTFSPGQSSKAPVHTTTCEWAASLLRATVASRSPSSMQRTRYPRWANGSVV
jgi:hypothetical protein